LALACILAAGAAAGVADARNPQIAGLQAALKARGFYHGRIDAVAGPATARALRAFQRRAGLRADGVAGPQTRAALGRLGRPLYGRRMLRRGRIGWDVAVLQFMLRWRGYRPGHVDGHFGRTTEQAMRRFQRRSHLAADGIAGRRTLARLCLWAACKPARVAPRRVMYGRYVVRWGDTLTSIARRRGISIAALAQANGLDVRRVLPAGRVLRIPAGTCRTPVRGPAVTSSSVSATLGYWAQHYGVDPSLARAIAWMESGYQNHVRSRRGAWGVMQITPSTWDFVETVLLGRRIPRTLEGNVRVGVAYLRHLLHQFHGDERLAVAAYYQGARAVRKRGLLPATRVYVASVLSLRHRI
jgi:hypothetical protein